MQPQLLGFLETYLHYSRLVSQLTVAASATWAVGVRIRHSKHFDVKKRAFPPHRKESLFVCGKHLDFDSRLD